MSIDPTLRLQAAMRELLTNAHALALAPDDPHLVSERRWILRLAERSLSEAGGTQGIAADKRQSIHELGRRVAKVDAATQRGLKARLLRLQHAQAEARNRRRAGTKGQWADSSG